MIDTNVLVFKKGIL